MGTSNSMSAGGTWTGKAYFVAYSTWEEIDVKEEIEVTDDEENTVKNSSSVFYKFVSLFYRTKQVENKNERITKKMTDTERVAKSSIQ